MLQIQLSKLLDGLCVVVVVLIVLTISMVGAEMLKRERAAPAPARVTQEQLDQVNQRLDEIEAVQGWQAARMGDISERGRLR